MTGSAPNDVAPETIRVFVSSTFRDMQAERDYLVTVVFPELRERLRFLHLELHDVDLRWGVPAADADRERTNPWVSCRRWIDRVEPFFICLLGQRYGWIPPATELAGDDAYRNLSITEMEIRHAVLSGRIRRRSYFYLRRTPVPPDAPPEIYRTFVQERQQQNLEALKRAIVAHAGRSVRYFTYPLRKRPGLVPGGAVRLRACSFMDRSASKYILVVSGDSCPSHRAMTEWSMPARRRSTAVVWRRTCGETRLPFRDGQVRHLIAAYLVTNLSTASPPRGGGLRAGRGPAGEDRRPLAVRRHPPVPFHRRTSVSSAARLTLSP